MLKLIKLWIWIYLILFLSFVSLINAEIIYHSYTDSSSPPTGVCTEGDRSLEFCNGKWRCYGSNFKDVGFKTYKRLVK